MYICELAIGGRALQKALPLYNESLTHGITAGVAQNNVSTKSKAGGTIALPRISRHSSKKSHEALWEDTYPIYLQSLILEIYWAYSMDKWLKLSQSKRTWKENQL